MGTMRVVGVGLVVGVLLGACGGGDDDGSGGDSGNGRPTVISGVIVDKMGTEDRADDERLGGVSVSVTSADGDDVGEDASSDDGVWSVLIPAPGTYTATIDEGSLPDGIEVTERSLEVEVEHEGHQPSAAFGLNEP